MTTIEKLINLNGRSALITGAAGGLGRVMAASLAELGADLILVDLPNTEISGLINSLTERFKVNVDFMPCDLEQEVQRANLISQVKERNKSLNILINNAAFVGTSDLPGWSVPFEQQTVDTWRRAFEVNLTAIFDLCQGLIPLLRLSEGANIINIASIYGLYGPDWSLYEGTSMSNPAAYSASKGGLLQFTRWLATTIAPDVRVNAVSPGGISRGQPEAFQQRYIAKTPLGRMAIEDDFCGVVAFLASDMSRYMTGQNLIVDGGWGI
ncbi:SDR family oxidoreductase [Synechococcus sp. UW140]|uniref:SDR family oxidoreductase n=1 Tax=Synechococcus sp. UW140 TaxID=368503 RepID=UPI0031382C3E